MRTLYLGVIGHCVLCDCDAALAYVMRSACRPRTTPRTRIRIKGWLAILSVQRISGACDACCFRLAVSR